MSPLHAVAIFAAGIAAGTINTVVGSGTLITFPVLLAFGYPAVTANVSNTIGLVPGSVSGAVGYRRELGGQRTRALRLGLASLLGGVGGAAALLSLPASAFRDIVPGFIALAVVLIIIQPYLARALASRRRPAHHPAGPVTAGAVFLSGAYGGYFGAAQGILLLAILGLALDDDLQRINALKVILAGLVNLVAGLVFVVAAAHVAWAPAGLIAGGSVLGGIIGAHQGRRLPPVALRLVIVVVGIVAVVRLV